MYFVFKDLFGNYLYDAIVNDTVEISDVLYDLLKHNTLHENCNSVATEYNSLRGDGFLTNKTHEITYPVLEYVRSMIGRRISKVTLQVTQQCNLRCKYCAYSENDGSTRLHTPKSMKVDTMIKSIDFIHRHSIDSKVVGIGFYGGEPLLNYPLIKQAIKYANQRMEGKELLFSMTTNATLLNSEMLNFFNNNNVALTFSIDGPMELNDRNRVFANNNKSTFVSVKEKIQLISEKYNNLFKYLSIQMVLDQSLSYTAYQRIYDEIPQLKDIFVRATIINDESLLKTYKFSDQFSEEIEYAKAINRLAGENYKICSKEVNSKNIMSSTFNQDAGQLKKLIGKTVHSCSPAGPCIPGYNKLFIDVDGKFLPCEKVAENVEDLYFGDVVNGFDYKKVESLITIAELTRKECEKCWCYHMCSSCAKYCVDSNGFSRNKRLDYCERVKQFSRRYLYDYVSMKRHHEL